MCLLFLCRSRGTTGEFTLVNIFLIPRLGHSKLKRLQKFGWKHVLIFSHPRTHGNENQQTNEMDGEMMQTITRNSDEALVLNV